MALRFTADDYRYNARQVEDALRRERESGEILSSMIVQDAEMRIEAYRFTADMIEANVVPFRKRAA